MTIFHMTIGIRGNNGKIGRQTFDLGDFAGADAGADFIAALAAANQIRGAYANVTEGNIAFVTVGHVAEESGVVPVNGADVHEFATVSCHLNQPAEAEKLTTVKILAPSDTIFIGTQGLDYDTVDRTDAFLVQYIQQLAQHAFVSDGEQIVEASGVNGMKAGRRNARSYNL